MHYPNGVSAHHTYNGNSQLRCIQVTGSSGDTVLGIHYTLLANGRREQESVWEYDSGFTCLESPDSNGGYYQSERSAERVKQYGYDASFRLIAESITAGGVPMHEAEYSYDKVGNRTYSIINGVHTALDYDGNDRLLSQGGSDYRYDPNGNRVSETLDGVVTEYVYNEKNQLARVRKDNTTMDYRYMHDGIRDTQIVDGITKAFIIDPNRDFAQVVAEVNNGVVGTTYSYGLDLIQQTSGEGTHYLHTDGLGSTRLMTDAAGEVSSRYDYEAFGELLDKTATPQTNYLFTGEQFDSNLGQYYLRARYYDQSVGGFTQMDTWVGRNHDPVTLNKYLYGNADPVSLTDPSGQFSIGSVMTGLSISARLTSIATSTYDLFQIATGEEEFSATQLGLSIILSRAPGGSFARKIARKYKEKTGRNLRIHCVRNSFVAGTLVHTRRGLIPIESIEIGDYVLSYNQSTDTQEYQEIIHLIQYENDYQLIKIEVSNGENFISTVEHPFYVDGEWKDAGSLALSGLLLSVNDEKLSIVSLAKRSQQTWVYNFTVASIHNYYIGKVGILVHNDNDCVISVANMGEFFDTPFGAGIKKFSNKTSRQYDGASIYKVTKNSGQLKKSQHYYLDNLHKDHLEVFDKNGKFLRVLNLDGSENAAKTAAVLGRSIKDAIK